MSKEICSLQPTAVWKHFYNLCQIPRPTGQMKAVVAHVVAHGNSLGLETKEDKAGNVLIVKPASIGMETAPTIILQAHLDMVPQKNMDVKHDFATDAIDAYIDGNRVKARSTTLGADNGIGAAAILAILEDKTLIHGTLEALFTTDEEVGMVGAFALEPGFLSGSIMLNLDTEDEGELCVGCAGGIDVNASFRYKDVAVPADDIAFAVSIKGLKGGHSGCEIHLGRANANKLMFRFLKDAVRDYEVRLSSIDGGSLRNAIPREAFAIITMPAEDAEELMDLVTEYQAIFREEYKDTDSTIELAMTATDLPPMLIPEEIQDGLIHAVLGCQNGVIGMLTDFEGIVETSTNLASVKSTAELIEVKILARSSSESRKEEIASSIESVFSLAGAKVEIDGSYPGWQPNIKSKTLDVMAQLFEEMYNKPAEVKVVHAGLECGIILGTTPLLDSVSFGPTIKNPHSPDEFVEIDTVERFYNYLLKTLERLK